MSAAPEAPAKAEERTASAADPRDFAVDGWVDRLSGFIARHRGLWVSLGNLETRLVGGAISDIQIDRPIHVCGLARSGTTILLETVAAHRDVATHRYRDFPPIFTPYLWNRWVDHMPRRAEQPAERTHKDGIAVTSESPEAFEEGLWMAFFPELHDPGRSAVLTAETDNPAFERFYRDHIRKLLAVRGRPRYAAKGNYNLTRMGYLLKLFPDARFVVPVRDPVWHIASLMKQHALFTAGQQANPKARDHLDRVGHFEFGLGRQPIDLGDSTETARIAGLWAEGREVEGWARYWARLHEHLADILGADERLRAATMVIGYEAFCQAPTEHIVALAEHCGLDADPGWIAPTAERISFPGYYEPSFTPQERRLIEAETGAARARLDPLISIPGAPVGGRAQQR